MEGAWTVVDGPTTVSGQGSQRVNRESHVSAESRGVRREEVEGELQLRRRESA